MVACAANATEAMVLLLDWGTPANAKDMSGRLSLHVAAEVGAAKACALLCNRGVNKERKDEAGRTAMQLGISRVHFPAVKEMLRAGAQVPENASAPGLAQIIKEVQMEKQIDKLKERAANTPEVTHEQLVQADLGVWQCQREHMRLLELREEQKAGIQLASFQERTNTELAVAERARIQEEENHKYISELRAELLEKKTHLTNLIKELNEVTETEKKAKEEDDILRAELKVRRSELDVVNTEIEERDALAKTEQEAIRVAQERFQCLTGEISEQTNVNEGIYSELLDAQRELEGWMKDREAAAKLTAQAHKLLGN